ncbi:MAG TPA: hypothetical protein VGK67_25250 [Myxococcales bacterium]|jgi:hypothetical protein
MVAHRPLPLLLGSLLLAAGCLPPGDPPPTCKCQAGFVCVDNACQPLACSALDETDCLGRSDCQASYAETADRCATPGGDTEGRCGGYSRVFMGCENKVCQPVMCDLYCAHGMARDERGCEVCACAPAFCKSNQECLPNESCIFPAYDCAENALCEPPQGVCTPNTDPGCSSDAECRAGETCAFPEIVCPPNAFCAPSRGTCKPAGGCTSDADCGVGRRCEFMDSCMAIGCPEPTAGGTCVDRTPCKDGAECGWGQTCAMDPNDPCVNEVCYFFAPAQTYCIPTCDTLGESDCLARRDCEAMYQGPRCGNDPTPAYFTGCKPVGCPPVMCDLWCAKGYRVDERGCNTCQCDDSCASDADCLPGQVCVMPMVDCAPGSPCPMVKGVCNTLPTGCASDAECAAGETCVFTSTYCGGGTDDGTNQGGGTGGCIGPAYGTCVKLQTPCTEDSQCKPGQVCSMPELICPPDVVCPTPTGTCIDVQPVGCTDDSQCLAGQRCDYDPMTNCGGGMNCVGQCVSAECRSDADCRAGESCIFLMNACPPGDPACPNTGLCNKVQAYCGADSDCAANELCALVDCAPNMDCMQQGVCTARPQCKANEECAYGESCQPDPTDICNSGEVYCYAAGRTICLPIPTCKTDADCAGGQKCLPDPTDPCNQPNVDCFAPGRTICQ